MTDSQTKQVREIQALLAERRKYEEWIAQLEARKASTPENVYAKVHGDYAARLTEAQARLSSETGAVHTLAAELEASLAAHERRVDEKKDERAEAELRASVGEYAEKEWDKLRAKLDGAITDLMGGRDACQREFATLQALLAEAAGSGSPGSEEAPPPSSPPSLGKVSDAPAHRGSAAAARPAPPAPAAATTADAAGGKKSEVDELAFLRSVLGRTTPYTAAGGLPAIPEPPAAAVPEPAHGKTGAARVSGVVPGRPSGALRAPAPEPELFTLAEEPAATAPEPGVAPPEGAREVRRALSALGAPTPRTSEAVPTLKCQECGTLNFPTEWYCERCGGELAAF